jgi:hypothetical protein
LLVPPHFRQSTLTKLVSIAPGGAARRVRQKKPAPPQSVHFPYMRRNAASVISRYLRSKAAITPVGLYYDHGQAEL